MRRLLEPEQYTPIAVRGDRLALGRNVYRGSGAAAFEVTFLVVGELDGEGRLAGTATFEPRDLQASLRDLEARYLAGEGALYADAIRQTAALDDALNARDFDAMRELWADDLVLVDHRPATLGTVRGRDAFIETVQALFDVIPDVSMIVTARWPARNAVMSQVRSISASDADNTIEISFSSIAVVRDGRVVHQEHLPVEDFDVTLARLHELARDTPVLANRSTEATHRVASLITAHDWGAMPACFAPDYRFESRRGAFHVDGGRDPIADFRIAVDLGVRSATYVPIAVRGTNLALGLVTVTGDDRTSAPFEVAALTLQGASDAGQITRAVNFAPDAIDEAIAELEVQYLHSEGAPFADHIRLSMRAIDAYNRRDWAEWRQLFADDFVLVDRRPATLGTIRGADEFTRSVRAMFDVIPHLRMFAAARYPSREGLIVHTRAISAAGDGSTTELEFHSLAVIRDGRIVLQEHFPVDALDDARARMNDLEREFTTSATTDDEKRTKPVPDTAGAASAGDRRRILENACTRAVELHRGFRLRGEWNALAESLAENVVHEDRRRGLGAHIEGRAANLEHARVVNEFTTAAPAAIVRAIRGDHLALLYITLGHEGPEGLAADMLWVAEIDEHGRSVRNVVFDADNADAAFAELDACYLADPDVPNRELVRRLFDATSDYNARNWRAYGSRFHPDAVTVDHRVTGWGETHDLQGMSNAAAMIDLIPDMHCVCPVIWAVADHGLVSTSHFTGTSPEGTPVEFVVQVVTVESDGLTTHLELFPEDALGTALARFAELAPKTSHGPA